MRINKLICDKCHKYINTDDEIRLDFMKKERDYRNCSLGFKKQKSVDLCQECYKAFLKEWEEN